MSVSSWSKSWGASWGVSWGGGAVEPARPEVTWPRTTIRKKRQGPDVGLARELIRQAEEAGQRKVLRSLEELKQLLPAETPPVVDEPKLDPGAIVAEIKEQALLAAELAELKRKDDEAALVLLLLD